MSDPFVPDDFGAPIGLEADCFRFEALGTRQYERDHEAWMSSIEQV